MCEYYYYYLFLFKLNKILINYHVISIFLIILIVLNMQSNLNNYLQQNVLIKLNRNNANI